MTEDNVMEFCQWLVSEKGIEAGNLSDYINNNEEEVLKLAQEFKKPKFKVGGKVEAAAEMFKCGGKANKVEKAQYGEKLSGKDYRDIKLNRGVIRRAAKKNFGFNNAQFQTAFENAKYGFRNQGLSRREANIAAQKAMINNTSDTQLPNMKVDLNNNMNIDRSVLDRVAEGPKKVFIESIDPVVTNSNYKINTDINWDNIGNDLELHLEPVNYGDKIFDGGQLDEISVIGTPVQKTQRTSGNNNSNNGFRTKTMPGKFGLAHYNQNGGIIKTYKGEEPITIPVKLDNKRDGFVTYNNDGSRKETIRRYTDPWEGTAEPQVAVTHRITTPDSTAMYVQYGPADEEPRRGYLYNTARKMGTRENANRAKFDPIFNELARKADFRITTLPNGKMVINDVVHTDNDTLSRVIDQGDTIIVNSAGDRLSNNSIRTRLARKIFGTSAYDQANKNFEMIDEMQRGGEVSNNKFDRFINRIIPAKQRRIDDSRKQEQYMHKYSLESMEPLQQEVKPLLEELMNWQVPGQYNMLSNKTTKIDNKKLAEYINQLTKK